MWNDLDVHEGVHEIFVEAQRKGTEWLGAAQGFSRSSPRVRVFGKAPGKQSKEELNQKKVAWAKKEYHTNEDFKARRRKASLDYYYRQKILNPNARKKASNG